MATEELMASRNIIEMHMAATYGSTTLICSATGVGRSRLEA